MPRRKPRLSPRNVYVADYLVNSSTFQVRDDRHVHELLGERHARLAPLQHQQRRGGERDDRPHAQASTHEQDGRQEHIKPELHRDRPEHAVHDSNAVVAERIRVVELADRELGDDPRPEIGAPTPSEDSRW